MKKELENTEREVAAIRQDRGVVRAGYERHSRLRRGIDTLRRGIARVGGWLTQLKADYDEMHDRFYGHRPAPDAKPRTHDTVYRWKRAAAAFVTAFGILFTAVGFYNSYSLDASMAAGVAVLCFLTASTAARAVASAVAARHEHEPRVALAELERREKQLLILLLVAAAALLAIGIVPPEIVPMAPILNGAIVIIAIASPLLAGLLVTTADVRGWSARISSLYTRAERLHHQMVELIGDDPDDSSAAETTPTPGAPQQRGPGGGRGPAIAAGFVIGLLAAGPVAANPPGANPDHPKTGSLWVDDSLSTDGGLLAEWRDEFLELIPELANKGYRTWRLFRFVDRAFVASPVYEWRLPAYQEPPCEKRHRSETAIILTGPRNAADKADKEACDKMRADKRRTFDGEQGQRFAAAKQSLQGPPLKGRCTGLHDLLRRVADEPAGSPHMVVVVTDGIDDCYRGRMPALPAPPPSVQVVMITVPTKQSRLMPSQQFADRKASWHAAAPWLKVISGSELRRTLLPGAANDGQQ